MCINNNLSNCEKSLLAKNTENLLSYNEVENFIESCNSSSLHSSLLLGNGFSRAYNDKNFDLSNLTQRMINKNPVIDSIFQHLQKGNLDIEETMRIVNDSKKVLECFYQQNQNADFYKAIGALDKFSNDLRNQFITTIKDNHISTIENSAKISAFKFIKPYNYIFNLNYDLLLYWVTSHNL